MEHAGVDGPLRQAGPNEAANGASSRDKSTASMNGPVHVNGTGRDVTSWSQGKKPVQGIELSVTTPFELPHITEGFFPFGTLINRSVQQCWVELSELVTELAAINVPSDTSAHAPNGKLVGNQSPDNLHKKSRILEFAHARRTEFIKLLVLSQWSRQAAEVSRLIDIQGFIRTRHQAYSSALQYVGEVKRDLVRAQVANPDLKTALEVLAKGKVANLPQLGYKPPKPLTARATLKKLHKINRIISVRLALHDQVPYSLRNYRVHDGRVTFTVPGEFELDLAVAEEANTSQFFFVDIRFLFSPSSPIPKGRIFDEVDSKVNGVLHSGGLNGCFDFLHGLVLTNKINTLFKQAIDLARALWSDSLRIEFLHRTLVIQYWTARAGPKSWLEIGVQRGQTVNKTDQNTTRVSRIGLRWMRDGQQANSSDIEFDPNNLCMESLLRSVIAHVLSLKAHLSPTEPGDCFLDIQMTPSRSLRVSIEPLSGSITLSGMPNILERPETERASNRSAIEEVLARVTRVRCSTAVEEVEFGIKALGLENVGQRGLGLDIRRLFPANTVRSVFFTHCLWDRRWVAAATSSMDGDSWWLIKTRSAESHNSPAHLVSTTLMPAQRRSDYSSCAELLHGLTGMLAIYSNARFLAGLPNAHLFPSLEELQLGSDFQVPNLFLRYDPSALPPALRLALPVGLERISHLTDTIRLSFHGIDHQTRSIALMAYGTPRFRIKSLLPLVSKLDSSLLIQEHNCGFALRLLVPAGHTVIVGLFERLQRFDCILSILQSLVEKGMEPKSLSLSYLAFSYGPNKQFTGRFDINVSGPSLSDEIDVSHVLSSVDPLFRLQLKISFDSPSPHRRIQQPLTVALNNNFTETGVDSMLGFMHDTFPLLHCLDQITNSAPTESSIVHVTARSPTVFQFHYPRLDSRFQLSCRRRQSRMVWLLDESNRSVPSEPSQSSIAVREKIYNSKGDGWQGLGDGAISSLEKIGNLLSELHSCLGSCRPEPEKQEPENTGQQPLASVQGAQTSGANRAAKVEAALLPKKDVPRHADVITID
ncbi:Mediator complex subunit Med14 [Penicillium herquei]|nr:Mediator complex subunit Med14 [Penicillium herquei]